ncbi:MAG: DUF4287 domain-containing protein [Bacteroidia bacterium]
MKTADIVVLLNERKLPVHGKLPFPGTNTLFKQSAINMDQALQTMIENLRTNSGKSLQEWIEIVRAQNLTKHSDIISYLKKEHGFTHGFANLVAHKSKQSDAGSAVDTESLVEKQYSGKEHFKPLYERIVRLTK